MSKVFLRPPLAVDTQAGPRCHALDQRRGPAGVRVVTDLRALLESVEAL